MKHILFVCLGNVCRSAMAEAIFQNLVQQKQLQAKIKIKSAGTSNEEQGNRPLPEVRKVLQQHGLNAFNLRAKQITMSDIHWADYIIGMDQQNIINLKRLVPKDEQTKIHLCLDINPYHHHESIPDPWYTRRFTYTFDVLAHNLPLWLQYILKH